MPWLKVSDDLPSKAETTRIPRVHRRAALGVWVLAGAWSAQQLTDGHIPEHMLDELSGTPEDAAWLVTAGFWDALEDGWQFIDWAPDQPIREVVLEARRKNAEKVKNWRSRNQSSNSGTNRGTNPDVTLPPTPTPTPSTSKEVEVHVHPAAAHTIDYEAEFAEWWELCWRKQAKPDAFKAFKAARKDTDLKTLIAGAQAYKLLNIGQDKSFLKLPAGWLRDRRWEDEQIPSTPLQSSQNTAREANPLGPRRIASATATECESHPGYPAGDWMNPCAACARESEAVAS